ncbi:MAG: hypothetical protein WCV82_01975 [Candidatus Paceibacterota bacterium]
MDQNSQPTVANANGEKKIGPIVAILIIVLVLIIAALYIFASRINQSETPTDDNVAGETNTLSQPDTTGASVQTVTGTGDDVTSLQNDLDTSTSGLDNQNF